MLVGSGAFFGAILRYAVTLLPISMQTYVKTLAINVIGSFVLALIILLLEKQWHSREYYLFFGVGLCGGFTTFSTFSIEVMQLIDSKQWGIAIVYSVSSVLLSLLAILFARLLLR